MRTHFFTAAALVVVALVAGCSDYTPPVAPTAAAKPSYADDLKACQDSGNTAAHHKVMADFPLWVTYPFSLPLEQRHRIRECMAGKGYTIGG